MIWHRTAQTPLLSAALPDKTGNNSNALIVKDFEIFKAFSKGMYKLYGFTNECFAQETLGGIRLEEVTAAS